jgi:chromosome segregation ATPase
MRLDKLNAPTRQRRPDDKMWPFVEDERLTGELEAMREELAALRAEAEQVGVTSAGLEEQLQEAKGRLEITRRAIVDREALLAEKHDQLRKAQLEEALQRRDAAAERLAEGISEVLVELEALEAAEQALSLVEGRPTKLSDQLDNLAETWERLKEAVRRRSDIEFADEIVEAAARSRTPDAMNALPAHLREAARARVQARRRQREERSR